MAEVAVAVPAPAPTNGATPPVVVTPPAPPPVDAERFAALAKKEQGIVALQQKLKVERDAFAKDQAAHAEWKKRYDNRLRDPNAYLEQDFGKDWIQKLNDYALNAKQVTPDLVQATVDKELSAFRAQQAEEKAAAEEAGKKKQQEDFDREMATFRGNAAAYVKENAATYELININDAHGLVSQVIEQHHQKTFDPATGVGKVLTFKEAADQVEKYLEEQVEKNVKSKRWQSRQTQQAPAQRAASSATLTSGMTASSPGNEVVARTEAERIQRAIKVAEEFERKARERAGSST